MIEKTLGVFEKLNGSCPQKFTGFPLEMELPAVISIFRFKI